MAVVMKQFIDKFKAMEKVANETLAANPEALAGVDSMPGSEHDAKVPAEAKKPDPEVAQGQPAGATSAEGAVNGGDATETFKLESVLGRLEVITTPAGAKISVDGKVEGVTRAQGDSEKSRILMIEKIAAGEHAVFAHLDGYLDVSRKVVVDAKETKQLYISLKRNFTPDTEVETINGAPVRGVLVKEKTTEEQLVLELRPGVEQAIRRETIRKITNLKE